MAGCILVVDVCSSLDAKLSADDFKIRRVARDNPKAHIVVSIGVVRSQSRNDCSRHCVLVDGGRVGRFVDLDLVEQAIDAVAGDRHVAEANQRRGAIGRELESEEAVVRWRGSVSNGELIQQAAGTDRFDLQFLLRRRCRIRSVGERQRIQLADFGCDHLANVTAWEIAAAELSLVGTILNEIERCRFNVAVERPTARTTFKSTVSDKIVASTGCVDRRTVLIDVRDVNGEDFVVRQTTVADSPRDVVTCGGLEIEQAAIGNGDYARGAVDREASVGVVGQRVRQY